MTILLGGQSLNGKQLAAPANTREPFGAAREKVGLSLSSIQVLVVEDFEPFRRFIVSTLQTRPTLQHIYEASDGLEAVQKAQQLRPDLIVLDIGLPTLNGLEAARQISKVSPKSKILFLSQESSDDVVQEALGLGASGYVVKANAGTELLPAVEAVSQGNQFVSSRLSVHWVADAQASASLCHEESLLSPVTGNEGTPRSHEVHFYSDDTSLLLGFTRFIESALAAGHAVIVIATQSHRKSLLRGLQAHGVDCAAAIEEGSYIALDVAEALSSFMESDLPDPVRFSRVAADLLAVAAKAAKGEHPRVAVCGEGVSVLLAQNKPDAAVQLEHLWNELNEIYDLDILCGYVLTGVQREQEQDVYKRICAEHSSVFSF